MDNLFNIEPIVIQQVNWKTLLKYFPNIIRNLDEQNIKLDDPLAFIGLLQENKILSALSKLGYTNIGKHGFWTFIGKMPKKLRPLIDFIVLSHLDTIFKEDNFIVSGSIYAWYHGLHRASNSKFMEARNIANSCQIYFEQTLFRESFKGFKKEYHQDGTFTLLQT